MASSEGQTDERFTALFVIRPNSNAFLNAVHFEKGRAMSLHGAATKSADINPL